MSNISAPTAGSPMSTNPYFAVAEEIRVKALGSPPEWYKKHIYALWALCGLRFCLCCLWMALYLTDLRRRGRKLRWYNVRKLQHGKIFVLNSLFIYAVLTALGSIHFALIRYQNLGVLFRNHDPNNLIIYGIIQWIWICLAAYVFIAGNVSALVMISSTSRGYETASKRSLWLHNLALVGVLVVFFAILIPMATITNHWANYFLEHGRDLILQLLAAGAAAEQGLPTQQILNGTLLDVVQRAVKLQDDRRARMTPLIWGLFAQTIVFGFFTALGSLISLRIVLRLRENLRRQSRAQLGVLGPVPMTPLGSKGPLSPRKPSSPSSWFSPQAPSNSPKLGSRLSLALSKFAKSPMTSKVNSSTSQESSLSPDTIAMTRLAADLSLAIPLVLIGAFTLPTCCFIGWLRHDDRWVMRELQLDGLVWPIMHELLSTNLIMLFFVINAIRHPTRYGRAADDNPSAGSGSGRGEGSAFSAARRSAAPAGALNIHLANSDMSTFDQAAIEADAIYIEHLPAAAESEFELKEGKKGREKESSEISHA